MNITKNPNNTTLIVIDVQQGLFERNIPIYQAEQVLENINALIDHARQAAVPVIFIQHSNDSTLVFGSEEWQYHPDIQREETETLIHKIHGDAFQDTQLAEELKKNETTSLVICGLVTHGCVRATSLGALKQGYQVTLVSDGHSNFSKDAPELIEKWNRTIGKKGAELKKTAQVNFSNQ